MTGNGQEDNPLAEGGRDEGIRLVTFRDAFKLLLDAEKRNVTKLAKRLECGTSMIYRYRDGNTQPQQQWMLLNLAKASRELNLPAQYHSVTYWMQIVREGEKV